MKILFIGDIVGKPGRNAVKAILPELKQKHNPDLVLANGENMAAGLGITIEKYQEMRDAGIDYFTSGNHVFHKPEIIGHLDDTKVHILRPLNYVKGTPGRGQVVIEVNGKKVQLVNLIGKAFMHEEADDYFEAAAEILKTEADIRFVDFHAEATSEKAILGFYLDGKVTVVVGTHTHIPTADERILPQGTAFQTDVGMTGPMNSSLGAEVDPYYRWIRFNEPPRFEVAKGPVVFNAVLIEIDDVTNKATKIERIQQIYNP